MKIPYTEYKHSYAFAIKPKIRSLYYAAFVGKKPANYVRKIILNALAANEVVFTEKEKSFFSDINEISDPEALYWRARNAVHAAESVFVEVDADGELARKN